MLDIIDNRECDLNVQKLADTEKLTDLPPSFL